jgi:FdhE protein
VTATTIIQPGEIERPAGEIPFLRIPEKSGIFRDRAGRLRSLAQGHSMKDFLLFMASVCDAQQAALNIFQEVPLPREAHLKLCFDHGMPPLSTQSWQRASAWREALGQLVAQVKEDAAPAAKEILARLQQMDSGSLEVFADAILSSDYTGIDLAAAPFVAAALQVYWTHMVTTLGTRAFGRSDIVNLCPACASPPVASVVRIGGAEQGLRYLSCSLCEMQWHMVRVKCSNCDSTKGIDYYSIAGTSGAVKAESCDECGAYLKVVYMDQDPYVDPVADDLATLALDLMMDDSGKSRSGPNLFLMTAPDPAG